MAEIEDILSRIEKAIRETKLKYVIVGGIAVIHYGHIRTTQDIDIIIEDNPSKISHFLKLLHSNEFDVMFDQFEMAYKEKTHFSIFDNNSFLRLDIKIADKNREYEVLNKAIKKHIFGKEMYFAPLEYVLIGKLIFIGRISDIPDSELLEYQDIIDFLTLFHANKKKVDIPFLRHKAKELGVKPTLNKLFSLKFDD
ncbi:MAG: hypothetical protein EU541_07000 [Promethearchaeota archaeon]|nr:MAG: hypothetical protein EU541_07000 [Candidatus Lokiarchaeota archaeon]